MRQIVVSICFALFLLVEVSAQVHAIKLNSTFALTNRPLGGIGYERGVDSSHFTIAINFEVGRYRSDDFATSNSTITSYLLTGAGIVPEVRHYASLFGERAPLGFFTGVFGKVRLLREISQHGILSGPSGYQLDSPSTEVDNGFAYDLGFSAGYKTAGEMRGLHAEIVLGYGISRSRLYNESSHVQQFFRLDFFLCGIFQSRHSILGDDFVW